MDCAQPIVEDGWYLVPAADAGYRTIWTTIVTSSFPQSGKTLSSTRARQTGGRRLRKISTFTWNSIFKGNTIRRCAPIGLQSASIPAGRMERRSIREMAIPTIPASIIRIMQLRWSTKSAARCGSAGNATTTAIPSSSPGSRTRRTSREGASTDIRTSPFVRLRRHLHRLPLLSELEHFQPKRHRITR